jgi:hypothetical protein
LRFLKKITVAHPLFYDVKFRNVRKLQYYYLVPYLVLYRGTGYLPGTEYCTWYCTEYVPGTEGRKHFTRLPATPRSDKE